MFPSMSPGMTGSAAGGFGGFGQQFGFQQPSAYYQGLGSLAGMSGMGGMGNTGIQFGGQQPQYQQPQQPQQLQYQPQYQSQQPQYSQPMPNQFGLFSLPNYFANAGYQQNR